MAISELTILYPQIALLAESISGTNTTDAQIKNISYGGGNLYLESDSSVTDMYVDYDLGSGNTASINFVAVRRANLLSAQDEGNARIRIIGSSDNFSSSNDTVFDEDNLSTSGLLNNSDLIDTLSSPSTAYRYWRIRTTTDSSAIHRIGKVYFGSIFDFGRSPSYPYDYQYFNSGGAFISDSGAAFKSAMRPRKRRFTFEWRAISDSLRNSFDSNIGKNLDTFQIALYHNQSGTSNSPLGGDKLAWGYGEYSLSTGARYDLNDLRIELTEDMP